MMRWLVGASLKFRLLVVALAAATLAVGASQLRAMPVDVLPEYAPPTVEIQTEALGLSASEVEQLITVPLEQDLLNGVAFLDDIRSDSVAGLSRVFMTFEPGTDIFTARQVVAERLTQAHALPHVSKPPLMLQPLSSTNRVMIIGASSKTVSPIEMSVLARWTIVPRLVGVPGVANVSVWGQRDRELQIQVDPEHLRAQDVTLLQILRTAGNALWFSPLTFVEASTPGTGGFIDTPNQRLGIQHFSPLRTPADLAQVRLEGTGERPLSLGDVASVVEDHQPLIGDALVPGGGGGLLFVVEKLPGANALDVTRNLEATINSMAPGLAGLEFDTTVYRPASFLETAIDNLTLAVIIGIALVALVFGAFFFGLRTALIGIAVIPLSLVAAALMLFALGATMNAIVLAGLVAALLVVIDGAVTGVDSVVRRLRTQRQEGGDASTSSAVLEASLQMGGAAAYATAIVALAVLPLFFLNGLSGAFFPDVAAAYLLALVVSMVVTLTVTPALCVLLLSRSSFGDREPPLVRWLQRGYEGALARIISRPRWIYVSAGAVVVATCAAVPFLNTSLLPTFKESELLIRWESAPGTSLPEMNRITGLASSELRSVPGVREVGAHVGRAVTSDQSVGTSSAEIWVSIDPSADYDATVASIREVADGYPGLDRSVATFSNERVGETLSPTEKDLVVRVYGEELDVLKREAGKVQRAIEGVDGITGASVALPAEEATLEIETNLAAAQRYGIKPGDVRRAAATLLSGIHVGSLFEEQKVFDVVVLGMADTRNSLTSVRQLLIDTPEGGHVRLGQVADVRIAPNPSVIQRQAVSRYLDVEAGVSGRDRGAVVQDVEEAIDAVTFPLEYHTAVITPDGQPLSRLIGLALAAAIGIFLVLQVYFGSWRLATLAFLTLPLAVTGGVLAAVAGGGTLALGSLIALYAIFTIAARNGILLMSRFRELEREDALTRDNGGASRASLVQRGAQERLAPILTTAFAAALVLSPFVIRGGIAGYELAHTMALVLVGGLVTSTLLSLFVLPVLYLQFGGSGAPEPAIVRDLVADLKPYAEVPAPAGAGLQQEAPVHLDPST